MTLHLVFSPGGMADAAPRMGDDDTVVLLGDGVYVTDSPNSTTHVLAEDLTVRGVSSSHNAIDYAQLVALCASEHPVVSWR